MHLTLISPQETIFQGEVAKATIPTEAGVITVLPGHIPLGSVVKPGILSFLPKDKHENAFIKGTDFLFKDDEVQVSVASGSIYVDGEKIVLLVSWATANPESDVETLEKMKAQLEKDIEEVKLQGDIDSIEKAYLSLQKLTADLHLKRMRHG